MVLRFFSEDHIHALLDGVHKDYGLINATITKKMEPVSVSEVYAMILTHDKHLKKHNNVNVETYIPLTNLS